MQRLFFSIVTDDRNIAQVGDTTSLYSARQKRFSSFNFAAVPPTTPSSPPCPPLRGQLWEKNKQRDKDAFSLFTIIIM